jgi:serine/threonine protein kinase
LPSSREFRFSQTETLLFPREGFATGTVFAGRYQVIEELGHGGMGRVYKVFDKETQSKVALKLIEPDVAADEKTIERFRNELKVARDISHKHICRMYDLGREGDSYFITMEYVSGEDLRSLLRRTKRLDIGTAVSIAKQVCEGLAEAHRLGVVHRDLKPSNIMIDREGDAKIMDFGIARSLRSKGLTRPGMVIGTPEYMSPEQVDGKEADERADLYSLTIILYEMVTGTVPFEGETPFAVGLKHKSEPPENPKKLNPQIPDELSRLILKGLEKDREKRFQSASEVFSELMRIEQGLPTTERAVPKRKPLPSKEIAVKFSLRKLVVPVIAVAIIGLGAVLAVLLSNKPSSRQPILPSHRQLTFTGEAVHPAISPDGKFIAYITGRQETGLKGLVQDLTGGRSIEVFSGERCLDLLWTPDGSEITVVHEDGVYLVPRLGGPRHQLEGFNSIAWSPDGSQYAGAKRASNTIALVNKLTGRSTSLVLAGPILFVLGIDWSPAGDRLLALTLNKGNKYALWTVKTDGSQQNLATEDEAFLTSPRWAARGNTILYLRGQVSRDQMTELWKVTVSRETGKPTKTPSLVLSGIPMGGSFTLSADGQRFLYTRESQFSNLWLAKVEGSGKNRTVNARPLSEGTAVYEDFSISPDGKRIAFSKGDGKTMNIYVKSIGGGSPIQLTFFNSRNNSPAWSPDGTEIAFGSSEGGMSRVWKVGAQGGRLHQFAKSELSETHEVAWAPRSHILYHKIGNRNYQVLNPETEEEAPLVKEESVGWMFTATYSPDGEDLAVYWNRQPTPGLWVISFKDRSERFTGVEGGIYPIGWSPDGKWIYAHKDNDYLMIDVESSKIETLPTIPFTIEGETHYMPTYDQTRVFINIKAQSDVWLTENFDRLVK